jgi:RNA polymerase sigma factor (sigma-70 family)
MWEQEGRNPVLGAPGSNNYSGLIASSTIEDSGAKHETFQSLSEKEANDLCVQYGDLAKSIAWDYRGKGIDLKELQSAADTGLVLASRRCEPHQLLSFGAYARYWIRGEITSLFKQQARNPLAKAEPIEQWSERQKHECDERVAAPDLTELTPKERTVIEGRSCDQSLGAIGKDLGISAERVRQIQNKAQTKLRKTKENYPLGFPHAITRLVDSVMNIWRAKAMLAPFRVEEVIGSPRVNCSLSDRSRIRAALSARQRSKPMKGASYETSLL